MAFTSIQNIPGFFLFFVIGVALIGAYLWVYTLSTAHDEFGLIRQNNVAAALALGLSLGGFAFPLSSAIVNSRTVVDLLVWGSVAIATQILAYWVVRLIFPNLSARIAAGEVAIALFLGAASLVAGLMTAACMVF